jgi:uncharacterized protein
MVDALNTVADFSKYVKLSEAESAVIQKVYVLVQEFFRNPKFDASHDFAHVERVTRNAISIFHQEKASHDLNPFTVLLGALLHDVEDRKYSTSLGLEQSAIQKTLLDCGLSQDYAGTIKKLVDGVSYSSEIKDPNRVRELILEIPELAVVQDADRLDAIGAIGIARCFTFGGAKAVRSLTDSVQHFREKLLKLEGMMKTEAGKQIAVERSLRIRDFICWWEDELECRVAEGALS